MKRESKFDWLGFILTALAVIGGIFLMFQSVKAIDFLADIPHRIVLLESTNFDKRNLRYKIYDVESSIAILQEKIDRLCEKKGKLCAQ